MPEPPSAPAAAPAGPGGSATAAMDAVKPHLRGWLHAGMAPLALAAGIVLVCLADGTEEVVVSVVYATTTVLLFAVSGLYHRGSWSPRVARLLKRLDHANIFWIIAGSYTPFAVLLLPDADGRRLLEVVWGASTVGVLFRVLWVGAPRWLYVPAYVGVGWAAIAYMPQLYAAGGTAVVVLLAVGGLLYSLGGLVYGVKRPDISPRWFGFHEVFHTLVVAGYVVHHVAVAMVVYR